MFRPRLKLVPELQMLQRKVRFEICNLALESSWNTEVQSGLADPLQSLRSIAEVSSRVYTLNRPLQRLPVFLWVFDLVCVVFLDASISMLINRELLANHFCSRSFERHGYRASTQ